MDFNDRNKTITSRLLSYTLAREASAEEIAFISGGMRPDTRQPTWVCDSGDTWFPCTGNTVDNG